MKENNLKKRKKKLANKANKSFIEVEEKIASTNKKWTIILYTLIILISIVTVLTLTLTKII